MGLSCKAESRIGRFGYLRVAELGALAWPQSPAESATEMARRTCKRLEKRGELLPRGTALGECAYVLTGSGAARSNAAWGTDYRDGYDIQGLRGATHWHRTLATAYLAHRARQGAVVWGEYALARGFAPVTARGLSRAYGKVPDGILELPQHDAIASGLSADARAYTWVEVEAAYKPDDELLRALAIAHWLEQDFAHGGILHSIVFVFDRAERHEHHIRRVAKRGLPVIEVLGHESVAHAVRLARCTLARPLALRAVEDVSLADPETR